MKILCDHQTGYLPWLGLFYRVSLCDIYVSLDTVKYQKRDFESRNRIKTPNGYKWLNVPTIKGESKLLKDIKINNSLNWKDEHLKIIHHSYGKCEYFDYYYDNLKKILSKNHKFLMKLNEELFLFFLKELNINIEFYRTSDYDISGTKNEYLINICKFFNADLYVFGQLGKDYADKDLWNKNKIKYYLFTYNHPIYPQRFKEFIPNLSIIDLLFNVGAEQAKDIITINNPTKKDLIKKYKS